MKIRKAIKKIVALGTGLTMLGATVFGAAALDLGQYPDQFIQDGVFDGLMVVGATAKTDDVLGVVDIATSLQYSARAPADSDAKQIVVEGDAYLIESNANKLELNETLGQIKSTIDDQTGLSILERQSVRTTKGRTDVMQLLKIGDTALKASFELNTEVDPEVIGPYIHVQNGGQLFVYEVHFLDQLKSDLNANNEMRHIQDLDLTLLGTTYSVVKGEVLGNEQFRLTLMGGALTDSLQAGETRTYELDGKSYEISVVIVAAADANAGTEAAVRLMVNGEMTPTMYEGETETLSDETVIGIRDVLAGGSGAGKSEVVSFYLGASKMLLDTAMEVDENIIDDVTVNITGTNTTNTAEISKIIFTVEANEDVFLDAGEKLSSKLRQPQQMISSAWDIMFAGLTNPGHKEISLEASGNDNYYLSFENQNGFEYRVQVAHRNRDGELSLGRPSGTRDNLIINKECVAISERDYFIVGRAADQFDGNSHILRYDSIQASRDEITIRETATGRSTSYTLKYEDNYANICGGAFNATPTTTALSVGGNDYRVWVTNESKIVVDLDGSGVLDAAQSPWLVASPGVRIDIVPLNATNGTDNPNLKDLNAINLTFVVDDNLAETTPTEQIRAQIVQSTDASKPRDLDIALTLPASVPEGKDQDSDDTKFMTTFGVEGLLKDRDGADSLYLSVPTDQVYYQVYVVGDAVSSSTARPGAATQVQRIQVGRSVLDTEVTNVAADNLIVVGGPCVNRVAATLLGISASQPGCYEDFPVQEGNGIIKMVNNGANVAIIVAGFSAADTRNAAQVIANYDDYAADLAGKSEVVVSGTRIMAAQVQPAAPAPVVEEAEEAEE